MDKLYIESTILDDVTRQRNNSHKATGSVANNLKPKVEHDIIESIVALEPAIGEIGTF